MNNLFAGGPLHKFLEQKKETIQNSISRLTDEEVCNLQVDEFLDDIKYQYALEPIVFDFENKGVIEQGAQKIDVSRDYRFITFGETNAYVDGQFFRLAIPFTGDKVLLQYESDGYISFRFDGEIDTQNSQVTIILQDASFTESSLKNRIIEVEGQLKHSMTWISNQVNQFNAWLKSQPAALIEEKRKHMAKRNDLLNSVGLQIKKRSSAPINVNKPIIRKKITAISKFDSAKPQQQQALDIAVYDEILTICSNMATVMELSPRAFEQMPEEDLRFHFLVQLNAVYEGEATGETFNLHGKTDILIKHNGQNIFVAECKYWHGEQQYREAINQLMNYVSWHDTKTAIIVFSRNLGFTDVLKKLKQETLNHPQCIAEEKSYQYETAFRYRFRHSTDAQKEFLLTVMAFNVLANKQ